MLDLAGVFERDLFVNPQTHENLGEENVPLVHALGDRKPGVRQRYVSGPADSDVTALLQLAHHDADRRLGVAHFVGDVDGSDGLFFPGQHIDGLQIVFDSFTDLHAITSFLILTVI